MSAIENLTAQSHLIYATEFDTCRLLPGINLSVPPRYIEIVKTQPPYNSLIEQGLFKIMEFDANQLYRDEETNITFKDDNGEKVPVTKASVNGSDSLVTNGKTFKVDELKAAGFPASLITKIVQQAPDGGWSNSEQIVSTFELTSKNADLVSSLDFN